MKTFKLLLPVFILAIGSSCDQEETNVNGTNECDAEILADCYAHNWQEFLVLDMTVDGADYKTSYAVSGSKSIFIYKATLNNICDNSKFIVDLSSSIDPTAGYEFIGDVYIEGEPFKVNLTNLDGIVAGHFSEELKRANIKKIEINNTLIRLNNQSGLSDEEWFNQNVVYHGMTLRYRNKK
ncbi:MAG: hypothetical protein IPK91_13985 [Saprospiraceae bacterium]|nr:hypothetical protein [Saprospiraceae bacterium]MBK8298355.1 hypothetical protein [Saprospiraceae bacterium]